MVKKGVHRILEELLELLTALHHLESPALVLRAGFGIQELLCKVTPVV